MVKHLFFSVSAKKRFLLYGGGAEHCGYVLKKIFFVDAFPIAQLSTSFLVIGGQSLGVKIIMSYK